LANRVTHLGRRPSLADQSLGLHATEEAYVLRNAEETFRLLYKMVEFIVSDKEAEERVRQMAEGR